MSGLAFHVCVHARNDGEDHLVLEQVHVGADNEKLESNDRELVEGASADLRIESKSAKAESAKVKYDDCGENTRYRDNKAAIDKGTARYSQIDLPLTRYHFVAMVVMEPRKTAARGS